MNAGTQTDSSAAGHPDTTPENRKSFLTPDALLEHWQGHQRLTRRTLGAFPEDQLFSFTPAPPMRPFGALVLEVIHMVEPTLEGLLTDEWRSPDFGALQHQTFSKAELLGAWDRAAARLTELWPQIPEARFHEVVTAYGMWTQPCSGLILYLIDNEVHHRAQGFVYLRLLGLEPPAFYER